MCVFVCIELIIVYEACKHRSLSVIVWTRPECWWLLGEYGFFTPCRIVAQMKQYFVKLWADLNGLCVWRGVTRVVRIPVAFSPEDPQWWSLGTFLDTVQYELELLTCTFEESWLTNKQLHDWESYITVVLLFFLRT